MNIMWYKKCKIFYLKTHTPSAAVTVSTLNAAYHVQA